MTNYNEALKEYVEKKGEEFAEDNADTYKFLVNEVYRPVADVQQGYEGCAEELLPMLVECLEALEKCRGHDMDCNKEYVQKGTDCGCSGFYANPVLKNIKTKIGVEK